VSAKTLTYFAVIVLAVVLTTVLLGWCFLIFILAAATVLYLLGRLLFLDDRRPDEVHYMKTVDGFDIAVWRVRPKTETVQPVPVILQHGLGANQRNFDLDDHYSLAHYLAQAGYDCYLPALRGCGPSAYRGRRPGKLEITFDQFVEKDMPAVFDGVRDLTGAPVAHFIGQSMGGMIGYAIAEGELAPRMRSLTSVCGPCFFDQMTQFKPVARFHKVLRNSGLIRQTIFTTLQAPLYRLWPSVAGSEEINPENMDGETLARAAVNVLNDMPTTLLKQFGRWVMDGDFGSHRGAESWQKNLHKITVPIYCFGGSADRFCAPAANNTVIEHVSSSFKRYRLFSKANGGLADYGHGDLIVGRTAPGEVYPTILEFLQEVELKG